MLPLEQDRDSVSFACFASPLETVVSDAVNALTPDGRATGLPSLTLPSQPYRPKTMSTVVWAPKQRPESAVFMAGFSDGWATLVHILATRFGHATTKVRLSSPKDEWPIVELVVYENGCERRLLRAMRDATRWEFFERGAALDFEEASAYSSRRIRDRFTPDMLGRYLSALGWRPRDDTFWSTDPTAFEVCREMPNTYKAPSSRGQSWVLGRVAGSEHLPFVSRPQESRLQLGFESQARVAKRPGTKHLLRISSRCSRARNERRSA